MFGNVWSNESPFKSSSWSIGHWLHLFPKYYLDRLTYLFIQTKSYILVEIAVKDSSKHCNRNFQSRCFETLQNHNMIHTGEKLFSCKIEVLERKITCHYCPKTFKREKIHSTQKQYLCQYCPKTFERGLKEGLNLDYSQNI